MYDQAARKVEFDETNYTAGRTLSGTPLLSSEGYLSGIQNEHILGGPYE